MKPHDLHLHHLQLQLGLSVYIWEHAIGDRSSLSVQLALHQQLLLLVRKPTAAVIETSGARLVVVHKAGMAHHPGTADLFLAPLGSMDESWPERHWRGEGR